jgi:hypothetical protein
MAQNKTQKTSASVTTFINDIPDPDRRRDCRELAKLMREVTGKPARMWGPSMVGFGDWHYEYESGRSGDWFVVGFSPRKHDLTLYLMSGFTGMEALRKRLGPHRTGKSCLYVKRLDDVDRDVLRQMIERSAARMGPGGPKLKGGASKVRDRPSKGGRKWITLSIWSASSVVSGLQAPISTAHSSRKIA